MVITVEVANFAIKKVLIDQGSSANIIYTSTFKRLQIPESDIRPYHNQLIGFLGERVDTQEYVDQITTFGDAKAMRTISIHYLVLNAETSYNILIGRPALNALGAIISTSHLVMTFPSSVKQIRMTRQCYMDSLKVVTTKTSVRKKENIVANVEIDPQPSVEQGPKPIEKLQHIQLLDHVQKNTKIEEWIKGLHRKQLVPTLRKT
ncbi:hypothetical protein CR513_33062, partial [Mucuna pruriens]